MLQTLTPPKFKIAPFLLGRQLFRGYVKLRGGGYDIPLYQLVNDRILNMAEADYYFPNITGWFVIPYIQQITRVLVTAQMAC